MVVRAGIIKLLFKEETENTCETQATLQRLIKLGYLNYEAYTPRSI